MQLFMLDYGWASDTQGLALQLTQLQAHQQWQIKQHEQGADREQWFIDMNGAQFLIFVEHLSESAWVESAGAQDAGQLQNFCAILLSDTAV
ncbi:DUF3630 family protein [Planctobacterium marinum]|uniref:DUF3630 family protein n=1 Tax=Planctobacterium marinum TaxID=1631968 RepID=UPI001E4B06CE|nr:DUF3630 family protein [Planctobacterium marinum]MCC2607031.1 DUF3630 family protein [Planctobacterium marinum]